MGEQDACRARAPEIMGLPAAVGFGTLPAVAVFRRGDEALRSVPARLRRTAAVRPEAALVCGCLALLLLGGCRSGDHLDCPEGAHAEGAPPPKGYEHYCALPDGTPHGPYRAFHPNGRLKQQGTYEKGKKTGKWIAWHENGKTSRVGAFEDDLETGEWTFFYESGEKMAEGEFEKGKKHGEWRLYYDTGKPKAEEEWAEGRLEGDRVEYFPNGEKKAEEHYVGGLKHGTLVYYCKNGQKRDEIQFRNGKENGIWRSWFCDGRGAGATRWKDGIKLGPVEE